MNMTTSEENFTEFFRSYRTKIYTYFLVCAFNNAEDGEELTGLLFEKVWARIENFDPEKAGLFSWAMGFAKNICFHFREKKQRRKEELIDPGDSGARADMVDPSATPDEVVLGKLFHDDFKKIIDNLPARQRDVIRLKSQGLKIEEICAQLGIKRTAVKERYKKGREMIVLALREQGYFTEYEKRDEQH